MLSALTLLCFIAIFYAYFGYPLILMLLLKGKQSATQVIPLLRPELLPSLTVIITVRNEEAVIREKLAGTLQLLYAGETVQSLLLQPNARVQVIVASDASEDGTDAVVQENFSKGVQLVRLDTRGGKEQAQRAAVAQAKGEIIVFTDAKISLAGDVLERFAQYFTDPQVGAVSSVDRVESDGGTSSGEGFYVRYEMWLRRLESQFNTLVGLRGSCFAVRREICSALDTNIPSDFALLIETRKRGLKGIHGADIVASYKAVRTEKEEFSRKVRTVLRGMTTFFSRLEVANPSTYGIFAWQILSHKLSRWLVPWFLLLGTAGCMFLAPSSWFFYTMLFGLCAFYGAALIGWYVPGVREFLPCKVPLFFIVSNSAVFVAWLRFLSGVRAVTWDPSNKGR